jgi:acetyltransferase-like isoleucine patch superfamily enzyme
LERKPKKDFINMSNLIILGAGRFASECAQWAQQAGHTITAFFEEEVKDYPSTFVDDIPVLNSLTQIEDARFIVGVGDPLLKNKLIAIAEAHGAIPHKTIIHPTAIIGRNVQIEDGGIICPNVIITKDVLIRKFVTVNIAPGANISGNVVIEDCCNIGTNACIREMIIIDSTATIGMGAVVVKHVRSYTTVVGNPAREI